ncbi:MAG: type I secretion system permease/ATPase [Alphaproteobacteria bacterium]|nr:type I secretion system permease/ATPase [Alphaproteobacteria bacterium]
MQEKTQSKEDKASESQQNDDAKKPLSEGNWQVSPSMLSAGANDALLGCLVIMASYYGRSNSGESLVSGLPLKFNKITPDIFVRAAARAGLNAKIATKELDTILDITLPAVLLLKDKGACILKRIVSEELENKEEKAANYAEIILPETGGESQTIEFSRLEEMFSGYVIFVRPSAEYRQVGEESLTERKSKYDKKSWFWGSLAIFWRSYVYVAIAATFINVFSIASSLFVMAVYDRVVPNNALSTLHVMAIGVAVIFIFDFLLRMLRAYFLDNAGKRADIILSSRIFEQSLNVNMKAAPQSSGAYASRFREFETIREFITSASLVALLDLPFILFFLGIIWYFGGSIVLVHLIAIPLIVLSSLLVQAPLQKSVDKGHEEDAYKQGIIVEAVNSLATVKSLGIESRMQCAWEEFVAASARTQLKIKYFSVANTHISILIQQLVTVGVVVIGVYEIANNNLTMGGLIACSILTGRVMGPLSQVTAVLSRVQQTIASHKRLDEIMNLPVDRPYDTRYLSRTNLRGNIEFRNVTFSYPGASLPALDNVSFTIKDGEKVGVIGRVGSGKSTIANLILRLYEPDSGAVFIDGTDVRQIDPADIRKAVGAMLQDVLLFRGTVRENIAMAFPAAGDDIVLNVAKAAGVHEFVSRHPMGYDMPIGERGQTLSGGQRQMIALARAMLPNPPVMLFDEPTSMLDMRSEQVFIRRMRQFTANKTMALITHRPSLLQLVDRVIVIGEGKIIADGPRDEVLKAGQENQTGQETQKKKPKPKKQSKRKNTKVKEEEHHNA